VDLGGSAIALAQSVFSGVKFKNKKYHFFGGVALILGAGRDDKHKYFFICPTAVQ
jgi:hypothetical protein